MACERNIAKQPINRASQFGRPNAYLGHMLILLIILLLLLGGGGGYYGHSRWGAGGGAGIGLGTILIIVLIVYLMGGIH